MYSVLFFGLFVYSVDERTEFDFQGLRMDWFRLQALTSIHKAPLKYASVYVGCDVWVCVSCVVGCVCVVGVCGMCVCV